MSKTMTTDVGSGYEDFLSTTVLQSDANETSMYRNPFDVTAVVVSSLIILPLAVFGILANLLTIYVVAQAPKLRSIFNYFIASLCVSDLISAILSPLFLYRRTWGYDHWIISNFLCKVFWGGDNGTSVATALHILCFAFFRLYTITWPHQYKNIKSVHAKICIIWIWIISLGCGFIPFANWMNARKMNRMVISRETAWPSCTISLYWFSQFKAYAVIGYATFFYTPFALISIFSLAVAGVMYLRRRRRTTYRYPCTGIHPKGAEAIRQRKERQAIIQLVLIVGSFMIGYIPHTAYHIYATTTKAVTHSEEVFHWWFGMSEYMCLRLSECLNPIFYNLGSSSMRKETMLVLRRINPCPKLASNREERSSSSIKISVLVSSQGTQQNHPVVSR